MVFVFDKDNTDELLERLQDDDIVEIRGADLINLLKGNSGAARGRKPIEIDLSLFDKTVERWKNGEITARDAMKLLDLKPNTFYRRIKERSLNDMKDVKQEINEVKNQIHEIAGDVKPAIKDKIQMLDIKREMRNDRIESKLEHVEDRISMKREVSREAKEYKDSNK